VTAPAAVLTVVLPAVAAVCGLLVGRSRAGAAEWGVLGALGAFAAACVEAYGVLTDGPVSRIAFLGRADLGVGTLALDVRADSLSACVAVAVGLVALCVQIYSSAYLAGPGTPQAPTRYRP